MLNIKDFLEDGVYVPNLQKKAEGGRKAQSLIIQHEEDGEVYTFKVVDSIARFRDKDWCVAVGREWVHSHQWADDCGWVASIRGVFLGAALWA